MTAWLANCKNVEIDPKATSAACATKFGRTHKNPSLSGYRCYGRADTGLKWHSDADDSIRSDLKGRFRANVLAVIRYAKIHGARHRPWLTAMLAWRPTKLAAIALANKLARMAWAMMARNERYQVPAALTA
ncbi:hypothetical protein [Bradyrhizobium sp. Arg816]|uniref:hypothetical protein n=1 Tax=Bradyrhizobium sp. Arg816 TaxID=2998491 RepID=UPI0038578315